MGTIPSFSHHLPEMMCFKDYAHVEKVDSKLRSDEQYWTRLRFFFSNLDLTQT